jgi:hypothetical protein
MIPVYDAANAFDAQLVHDLLQGAGMPAHVSGTGLVGAVGELPAEGLVQVWVHEEHAAAARELIREWLEGEVPDEDELVRLADSQAIAKGEFLA